MNIKDEIYEQVEKRLAKEQKEFSKFIDKQTIKYEKKYGFEVDHTTGGSGTHNNEADAFKHAFMQAWLSCHKGHAVSKILGNKHEYIDGPKQGQPQGELDMDLNNNVIGRQVGNEIFDKGIKHFTDINICEINDLNDLIADKVIQKMNEGKLILKPGSKPSKPKKQYPTFFPAPDKKVKVIKSPAQRLEERLKREWSQSAEKLKKQTNPLASFTNRFLPSDKNKIFTKEEVETMDYQTRQKYRYAIKEQKEKVGLPTCEEANKIAKSGGLVHVKAYVRGDGVHVHEYYRSRPNG